ncbi:hypothetical protein C8R42DRAFT_262469 [Lentinula raphanica]|nr:hypothetical protein C8R42DRAFT_262469 [Lentinula raphanica]
MSETRTTRTQDNNETLSFSHLDFLVIDKADLVHPYGRDDDIRQIFSVVYLPKVFQLFLKSATMTEDVDLLKSHWRTLIFRQQTNRVSDSMIANSCLHYCLQPQVQLARA